MSLIKVIAAVAALGLAGVEAGGAPICSEIFPRPKAHTCNVEGYVKHVSAKLNEPIFKATAEACADHCAETDKCTSFLFREGLCQPYKGSFSKLGFSEHKSFSYWYEMECFKCNDGGVIISVDFEDGNNGKWNLLGGTKETFSFDTKAKGFQGSSTALRVVERTTNGEGRIEWADVIPLKAGGTYSIGFTMKNSKHGATSNWALLSSELLTISITSGHKKILRTQPEHPKVLAEGWTQFHSTFKVPDGLEEEAVFSIGIKSSGTKMNWYFDNIYIKDVSK
ncbi:hypothetical protein EDB80DRAFT_154577 [Ilyonectria destructans]|nr:hypothetical protein EDB80DRAFT_154577 [Ilyonectria destructans]